MPNFSKKSSDRLQSCHSKLQTLAKEVVKKYDITIACGHRTESAQNLAFSKGYSTLMWPHSKHNSIPSLAVDIVPYPELWKSKKKLAHLMGYIKATAERLNIKIRQGIDWDMDNDFNDQSFHDLPHIELV